MTGPGASRRKAAEWGWLCLLSGAAYLTSLTVPFIRWDDPHYVVESYKMRRWGWEGFWNVWSMDDVWRYHALEFFPLRDTAYWLLYGWFGATPLPFHAVSVAAHAACVLLMVELGPRMGFSARVSFWGAALFALHPVHVESITWVSGLKDPLCLAFILAALHCYSRYREEKRPWQYGLFAVFMVASLLVKSLGLVTPLLALLMERAERAPWKLIAQRLSGPAGIAGLFLGQYLMVGRYLHVITGPHGGTWLNHLFLAGWAQVRYVQQALVPATFSLVYCFPPPRGLLDWRVPLAALLPVGVAVSFVVALRRDRRAAVLIAWFFICLLPVSNIVPFPAMMADRYLYASTVASCVGSAWLLARLPGRVQQIAFGATAAVFLLTTLGRGVVWQHESNLWAEADSDPECQQDPEASVVRLKHFQNTEDPVQALRLFEGALAHPGFGRTKIETQCEYFAHASQVAQRANDAPLVHEYASRATALCPWWAPAWTQMIAATAHDDPVAAADAARRSYRLKPSPNAQWAYGMLRLSAGDAGGEVEIAEAVASAPGRLCVRLRQWMEARRPADSLTLRQAMQTCEASAETAAPP